MRRLLKAIAASAATGTVIYVLVMRVAMPSLEARLTDAQLAWLRGAFTNHPFAVLGAIVFIAALLGLPVLMVFWWQYHRAGDRGS